MYAYVQHDTYMSIANTVLRYIIFSDTETYENIYATDIQQKFSRRQHANDDTPALPQLLLPLYPCLRGISKSSPFHQPSLRHALRSPQLMHTTRDLYKLQFRLCENYFTRIFFDENLLDEIKANYGIASQCMHVLARICANAKTMITHFDHLAHS